MAAPAKVDYYGTRAFLAQSPQLYEQIMVAVYERFYEVAPVYRAEPSHTNRHLSEQLSLDVEFGFIESDDDVMALQEALVKAMLDEVRETCAREIALLGAQVPDTNVPFPRIALLEARELVRELEARRTKPEAFAGYLKVVKHGMPPHGGFAIGAERLTALLLGIANIRFARAFPRDGQRLQP